MIRSIFILIAVFISTVVLAQKTNTFKISRPSEVLIATRSFMKPGGETNLNFQSAAEFVILSLVDSILLIEFDRYASAMERDSSITRTLLVVAKNDDSQKADFMLRFAQNRLRLKDLELSYKTTLSEVTKLYGVLDFKSRLIIKK